MEICPECDYDELNENECSNIDCLECGSLFSDCPKCGWQEHPYCVYEEDKL